VANNNIKSYTTQVKVTDDNKK